MTAKTWLLWPAVLSLGASCGGARVEVPGEEAQSAQGLATCESVSLLKDLNPAGSAKPDGMMAGNGVFFFTADNGVSGRELWKSDGTAAGTELVKDIHPSGSGATSTMAFGNGTLFLAADNGVTGLELWKSDGTAAGTVLVKDIHPSTASSSPADFTFLNNTVFFAADNGAHGVELWKSDGTAAGTVLLKDINTTPTTTRKGAPTATSSPTILGVVNGVVLFSANNGVSGAELWRTDGTAAGTVLVKDIYPGSGASLPRFAWVVGGQLLFFANDGVHGEELWRSDGTAAGTVLVKDIYPGSTPSNYSNNVFNVVRAVGASVFFVADDSVHGYELWKSDGTEAGTVLVKDVTPGPTATPFTSYTVASSGDTLFYSSPRYHLWKSDGTEEGTSFVVNPSEGRVACSMWCYPDFRFLRSVGGTLYFGTDDGIHGYEVWKTDGTAAGSSLVKDINPGSAAGFSESGASVELNGSLFFNGTGPEGSEVWRITPQPCP